MDLLLRCEKACFKGFTGIVIRDSFSYGADNTVPRKRLVYT
jgi:hypothetical protein